jgi:hypothetical protein
VRGAISHCRQGEDQCAKTDRESGTRRSSETSPPPWRLTDDCCKIRRNAGEGSVYIIDQDISRLAQILNIVASEIKNFAELIDRVCGVIRNIL